MTDSNATLTKMLLDDRVNGLSYLEIEDRHGIPAVEARQMVMEALADVVSKDPLEQRGIITLQIEKVIRYLTEGLEAGSFKHGEAIIKATERLSELHDLNQQTIKHEVTVMTDENAQLIFEVLKQNNNALRERVRQLELSESNLLQLDAWPEWEAEAATEAVTNVIYAEVVED